MMMVFVQTHQCSYKFYLLQRWIYRADSSSVREWFSVSFDGSFKDFHSTTSYQATGGC